MTRTISALVAIALVIAAASLVSAGVAQSVGPIGPGPAEVGNATVSGHLLEWERPGTATLVLHGFGRGLRVFADIATDGVFELRLPPIDDGTPLGSVPCNPSGGSPVGWMTEVSLLTPLEGFTTPSEADRGLSVIGMAALADASYAMTIASPGSRRVAWIASRVAQTFAVGDCNNTEPFDVGAGWTPVTITFGPSGGPHDLTPGVPEDVAWYWWAFVEPTDP